MLKDSFKENGYALLKGLIQPDELYTHMHNVAQEKNYFSEDPESSRVFYKEPRFEKLMVDLLSTIEEAAGVKLYKTYSFGRIYNTGDVLTSHRDRSACEISVSICLGCEKPWPIWILDKDERALSFELHPGDAIMFKGIKHAHWRERNTTGQCSQVFLHYVDQNGPYAAYKDDSKKTHLLSFGLLKRKVVVWYEV